MKKERHTGKRRLFQKIAFLMLVALVLTTVQPAFAGPPPGGPEGGPAGGPNGESSGGPNGESGGDSAGQSGAGAQGDEEVQAILDEVAASSSVTGDVFVNGGDRFKFDYQLYSPENVSADEAYPIVVFIPDTMGGANTITIDQYYGAAAWCSAAEQAKHPAYVAAVTLPTTNIPNQDAIGFAENVTNLLTYLGNNINIDKNRIYLVCQGEGCMAGSFLALKHPELFAAILLNAGSVFQDSLKALENQKFFYIASAADNRANESMLGLMGQFDTDAVPYIFREWNAKEPDQDIRVQELSNGAVAANFIRFEPQIQGEDGQMPVTLDHLNSFNYGYKNEAVRDWIFAQSLDLPVQPVEADYGAPAADVQVCPNCGEPASGKFCGNCGAQLIFD